MTGHVGMLYDSMLALAYLLPLADGCLREIMEDRDPGQAEKGILSPKTVLWFKAI